MRYKQLENVPSIDARPTNDWRFSCCEEKSRAQLEAWRSAPKRTALLVTGARQIGKTYIIRHFAQQHYDHIAELNFIENPDLVALFDRPRDAKTY